jgi:hypothetical protein
MKHPVRSDFDTVVTEVGVTVTFKPTNSIYSFYRLAGSEDVARLGSVSLERVRHAGPKGDTEDYPADEVQAMAQRIASDVGASVWSVQDEKEADKSTLRHYSVGGDHVNLWPTCGGAVAGTRSPGGGQAVIGNVKERIDDRELCPPLYLIAPQGGGTMTRMLVVFLRAHAYRVRSGEISIHKRSDPDPEIAAIMRLSWRAE